MRRKGRWTRNNGYRSAAMREPGSGEMRFRFLWAPAADTSTGLYTEKIEKEVGCDTEKEGVAIVKLFPVLP